MHTYKLWTTTWLDCNIASMHNIILHERTRGTKWLECLAWVSRWWGKRQLLQRNRMKIITLHRKSHTCMKAKKLHFISYSRGVPEFNTLPNFGHHSLVGHLTIYWQWGHYCGWVVTLPCASTHQVLLELLFPHNLPLGIYIISWCCRQDMMHQSIWPM